MNQADATHSRLWDIDDDVPVALTCSECRRRQPRHAPSVMGVGGDVLFLPHTSSRYRDWTADAFVPAGR
jgi:hypothetical protein